MQIDVGLCDGSHDPQVLVHQDGNWWIASIAWDEEIGAGPIPAEYLPPAPQ